MKTYIIEETILRDGKLVTYYFRDWAQIPMFGYCPSMCIDKAEAKRFTNKDVAKRAALVVGKKAKVVTL